MILASFSDWSGVEKFYAICALTGGIFFILRLAMQFIGSGDVDFDGDVDFSMDAGDGVDAHTLGHPGDSPELNFRVLSLQGITSFFMMFGIVGLALLRESGWDTPRATLGALAAGVGSVWVIKKIFEAAGRLQSSGNVRLDNAVGQQGQVYLRIPAQGSGQIQVPVQGRLIVCDAEAADGVEIASGEAVEVVGISGRLLRVRRSCQAQPGGAAKAKEIQQ